MSYTNFTQLMRDRKGSLEKKTAFVRQWLRDTYHLDYDTDAEFFAELTRVHDHDNMPLHFGRVPIQRQNGTAFAELQKNSKDKWAIAVANEQDMQNGSILAPYGTGSENDKAQLNKFATFLRGSLPAPAALSAAYQSLSQYSNAAITAGGELGESISPAAIPAYLFAAEGEPLPGIRVAI